MACDRFTGSLRARAHGGPLAADAAAHLAVCSTCQAMLEREERLHTLIDQATRDVLSTEPAPDFADRIRGHVEHSPRSRVLAWRLSTAFAALVLVAAASALLVPGARERAAGSIHPVAQPAARAAGSDAQKTAMKPVAGTTGRAPAPRSSPRAQPVRPTPASDVLVPAGQRERVGRLFESLRAGRPEVVSMLMNIQREESGEPPTLSVAPLRIEPVVVTALPIASIVEE